LQSILISIQEIPIAGKIFQGTLQPKALRKVIHLSR